MQSNDDGGLRNAIRFSYNNIRGRGFLKQEVTSRLRVRQVAMVRCEETNDQLKHLLGPETLPTSTPLPSRRTSAPEHHATTNGNAPDGHHCGWVNVAEQNCYCETDHQLALSHIPSANWTYNDEEDEEKLSCSHTTEGSDGNKR